MDRRPAIPARQVPLSGPELLAVGVVSSSAAHEVPVVARGEPNLGIHPGTSWLPAA